MHMRSGTRAGPGPGARFTKKNLRINLGKTSDKVRLRQILG